VTATQRIALWTAAAVAGVSGLAYAAMKYLLPRADPFSAFGHPFQPYALKTHVLAAPVLLFVVGWLYGAHAQHQLRNGDARGRASGRGILALTFVLALSGYLVQAFADAAWRPAAAWVHGLTGTAFVAALAGHAVAGRRGRAVAGSAGAGGAVAAPGGGAGAGPAPRRAGRPTCGRSPSRGRNRPGRRFPSPGREAPAATVRAAEPPSWRAIRAVPHPAAGDRFRELTATRLKFASPGGGS
jgi:hypothetical protein